MLSSKANAALARLKEIEKKYKMKREEQKWNRKEDTDSSISSVSIIPSENPSTELKKSPRNVSKLKLDIKIPDLRLEGRAEETKLSSENKKSTPNKMNPESLEDEADLDVTVPSKDKSPPSTGKQESLISDVTSIQENSSIESVLDDSMISSKSLSRSKTSGGNFSTVNSNKSSKREERTKAAAKYEKGKESDKSSEISKGKASSGNSSIIKQSRSHEKSNEKIFKMRSSPRSREQSIEEKVIIKIPNAASFDQKLEDSRSLRDDSVIEESIDTVDNGSEIISELSNARTSITAKSDDSIKSSKYLAASVVSSDSKQLAIESGYANDTFEDVSSSTLRSQSQREKIIDEKKEIDSAGSSAKKTDAELLGQYKCHQNYKSNRNGHVIEFVASKSNNTIQINMEPTKSNYINDLESNVNLDNVIVRLIRSPKSASSSSEKHYQQHRPEPFETNVSSESLTGGDHVTKTDEKKNLPEIRMTSVEQESGQEERRKSNKIRERAMTNITGPPVADEESIIKSSLLKKNETEKENVFEENSSQRIIQDAENVLKKLHKDAFDALVKRHMSSKNTRKASVKSFENEEFEIKDVIKTRKKIPREENESRSSEENKIRDRKDHKSSNQKKKKKKSVKITNSKTVQARNTGSRKKDKDSKFDEKQKLQKQIIELQLQQEREDLQKYLQELKNSRLESDSTQSYFSPLEFPKIAEFTQLDAIDLESKSDDQHVVLRQRISAIKRYLKDQYILYRDYCTMTQAINAHYVPTTLQDAKKTIRKLQKMTIKTR